MTWAGGCQPHATSQALLEARGLTLGGKAVYIGAAWTGTGDWDGHTVALGETGTSLAVSTANPATHVHARFPTCPVFDVPVTSLVPLSAAPAIPAPWTRGWDPDADIVIYSHPDRTEWDATAQALISIPVAPLRGADAAIAHLVASAPAAPEPFRAEWWAATQTVKYRHPETGALVATVKAARIRLLTAAPEGPAPWKKGWDRASGAVVYTSGSRVCRSHKEAVEAVRTDALVAADPLALPAGWRKRWDPESGRVCYVSGSWEKPCFTLLDVESAARAAADEKARAWGRQIGCSDRLAIMAFEIANSGTVAAQKCVADALARSGNDATEAERLLEAQLVQMGKRPAAGAKNARNDDESGAKRKRPRGSPTAGGAAARPAGGGKRRAVAPPASNGGGAASSAGGQVAAILRDLGLYDAVWYKLVAEDLTDFEDLREQTKSDLWKIGLTMGQATKIVRRITE